MQNFYIATVFFGALVYLLSSIVLFLQRKSGDRSRIVFSIIILFTFLNYIVRFISMVNDNEPELVLTPKLLLVANFMLLTYIMYPLEVISPGWLNFRHFLKLYSGWFILVFIYLISKYAGVEYTSYSSLIDMIPNAAKFEVWFRLLLALSMFSSILFVVYLYRTNLYRNSDHVWINIYIITFLINVLAYILVLMFDNIIIHIIYDYISVGRLVYFVYLELFDRLIGKQTTATPAEIKNNEDEKIVAAAANTSTLNAKSVIEQRNAALIKRLETYMKDNNAWRDPDLSLNTLASELYTNRTTLAQVLQDNGYENYTNYIKKLRIDDFLQQIESGMSENFQEAFFYVGFRSRSTALRNFQQVTGVSPSEYFQKKNVLTE